MNKLDCAAKQSVSQESAAWQRNLERGQRRTMFWQPSISRANGFRTGKGDSRGQTLPGKACEENPSIHGCNGLSPG